MLRIKFYVNQNGQTMTLTGHAGMGKKGSDIVCAAASMLACTAAQTMLQLYREGQLKTPPKVSLTPGNAYIQVFEACPGADSAFFTVRTGCALLAGKYPKNIHLEICSEERNTL